MKIAIITDTNSGITAEEGKRLGIYILPMPVLVDGTSCFEGLLQRVLCRISKRLTTGGMPCKVPFPGRMCIMIRYL